MTDSHTTDTLLIAQDTHETCGAPEVSMETPAATHGTQRAPVGFGGSRGGEHLFTVNSEGGTDCADFLMSAEAALDELLDDAVMAGEAAGGRLWLIEHLTHAIRAVTNQAVAMRPTGAL